MVLGGDLVGEGTYELKAGTLETGFENVDYIGKGIFTQTEGTNTVANNLNVGYATSATGTLIAELGQSLIANTAAEESSETNRILPGFRAFINNPTLPQQVALFTRGLEQGKSK